MKIYVAHGKIDFKKDLYEPIRNSELNSEHEIVFPHENSDEQFESKKFLKEDCDLVIAESSVHSTGMGIELGWTDMFNVPIICVYKKGNKPAGSLRVITDKFLEYSNSKELVSGLKDMISKLNL